MNESFTLWAENEHVLCQLVQWDELFGPGGGAVQFSRDVTIHAPDASIGNRDRTVILRVVCAGPGNVSRGARNPCRLEGGDLVVANLFHRTDEVTILGSNLHLFNWDNIMAKLDIDEALHGINMTPLQCYLVCKPNEAAAQRLMMGKSRILSPNADAQFSTDDAEGRGGKASSKKKVVIEECVQVGPGAVVDGLWQEPPSRLLGGMVMFDTSVAPVRFVVGGQTFSLVHWRHVLLSFCKDGAEAQPKQGADGVQAAN